MVQIDLFTSVATRVPATLPSEPPKPATNTVLAYEANLRGFSAWCCEQQPPPELPVTPKLVASYRYFLWATQKRRRSAVERAMFAIGSVHDTAGLLNQFGARSLKMLGAPFWSQMNVGMSASSRFSPKAFERFSRQCVTWKRAMKGHSSSCTLQVRVKRDELRLLSFERIVFATDGVRVTVASGDRKPLDVAILTGMESFTDPVAALRA